MLTSIISCHSSGVNRRSGFLVMTPALLTRTFALTPPSALSISLGTRKSATHERHSPPDAAICSTSECNLSASRDTATTECVAARRVATARPMPREAPVTTAIGLSATRDSDAVEDQPGQFHRESQRGDGNPLIVTVHASLVLLGERERQDSVRLYAGAAQRSAIGGAGAQERHGGDTGCHFSNGVANRGKHGRIVRRRRRFLAATLDRYRHGVVGNGRSQARDQVLQRLPRQQPYVERGARFGGNHVRPDAGGEHGRRDAVPD